MKRLSSAAVLVGLSILCACLTGTTSAQGLQFSPGSYNYTVQAVLPVNSIIIQSLSVNSVSSSGSTSLIQVTCSSSSVPSDACSVFSIVTLNQDLNYWLGRLVLARQLNFQQTQSYSLVLQASNGVSSVNQVIRISVVDRVPPVFTSSLTATINEITDSQRRRILELTAIDGDSSQRRPVRYQLLTNPGNYFSVDSDTGRVFNTRNILWNDTNWSLGFITITVQAAIANGSYVAWDDPKSSTTADVTISLFDNENAPVFGTSSYSAQLAEKSPQGAVVPGLTISVTSTNLGVGSYFELFLDNHNNLFAISPMNGSRAVQSKLLVVNGTLLDYDFGQRVYTFRVIARDLLTTRRLASSTNVTISLFDINDHDATFVEPYFIASVSELAPSGTPIIKIQAYDLDASSIYGNASIRYNLVNSQGNSRFRLNPVSGQLTVAPCSTPGRLTCIDFEQQTIYNLTVVAADKYGDGTPTRTSLWVYVLNQNDNPPVFQFPEYVGSINEYAPTLNSPLQVQATDADRNTITYSLTDSSGCNCWVINSTTGSINNTRPVNWTDTLGRQGFFLLTARASDGLYTVTSSVRINVVAVNMYTPVFSRNDSYSAIVPSNQPAGSVITQISATDLDSPYTGGGQVRYRILRGCQDQFTINLNTGEILVASGVALTIGTCTLDVQAYDQGQPSRSVSSTVMVTVVPATLDSPIFVPSTISVTVLENSPIGLSVVNVSALAPANASLKYSLLEPIQGFDVNNQPVSLTDSEKNQFIIDPTTGEITLNGTLNRDRMVNWRATIAAVDTNSVPPKTGTGTVIMTIAAYNDRPPVFIAPWTTTSPEYNVTVQEDSLSGTYVTTMIATDPNRNNVYYKLISSNPVDQFSVDNTSGIVTLSKALPFDANNPNPKYVVIAYDDGQPSRTSTATVNVFLARQNKQAPVFNQTVYTVSIPEFSPNGTRVTQLYATFADAVTFGPVRYTLVDSFNGYFSVDPITGWITVAPGAILSRAVLGTTPIPLLASAYNNASDSAQRRTSYVSININLVPINVGPTFSQASYTVTVPDSAARDQFVVGLTASTSDTTLNQYILYGIVSADQTAAGLFALNNISGVISTAQALLGFAGTYRLNVSAYETRTPSPFSFVSVTIIVTGSPGQPPVWISPSVDRFQTVVYENVPIGWLVYTVRATSSSGNAPVTYTLTDTSQAPVSSFIIDPVNGTITVNQTLNWDQQSIFTLLVTATDTSNSRSSSRLLFVQVLPIYIPVFPAYSSTAQNCCPIPYNFTIGSNSLSGYLVGSVQATIAGGRTCPNPIVYTVTEGNTNNYFQINGAGQILVATDVLPINAYSLKVRATCNGFFAQNAVAGCVCSNRSDVNVFIPVVQAPKLTIDVIDIVKCLSEDAEVGDFIGQFSVNYQDGIVLFYVQSVRATFKNGTSTSLPVDAFKLSSTNYAATLYLNRIVDQFSLIAVTLNASYSGQGTARKQNQSATTEIQLWITQPRYEILVTTDMNVISTNAGMNKIISDIKSATKSPATEVCIVDVRSHVATAEEPSYGLIDTSRTDMFMYVIDGNGPTLLKDFHVIDSGYSVDQRIDTGVIGITAANPYWASFNFVPIAAAVGIIIGLLLLALLLMCCCVCWAAIIAVCIGCCVREKEPLIFHDTTSAAVPVQVAYANPMTRRLLEDQLLTMAVGSGDQADFDGTATAYASGRTYDVDDSDVFAGAGTGTMQSQQQLIAETSQRPKSRSLGAFEDVHIVAPLAAPQPVSYDVADGGYDQDTDANTDQDAENDVNILSTTHTTTTRTEEHTNYQTDGHLRSGQAVSEMGVPSLGGLSGRDSYRSPQPLSENNQPSTVTLNEPSRRSSARIGATLYQAPSPHSGFTPTQNVVSASSYPADDRDRVIYDSTLPPHASQLPLQREILYNDMPNRSSLVIDSYDSQFVDSGQLPHHANVYQGQIHLNTMTPSRPISTSRGDVRINDQETRFMM